MKCSCIIIYAGFLFAYIFNMQSRAQDTISSNETPLIIVNTNSEPMATGKFAPTWESLRQYETPEWFRNAKFGIWAHWGPQCQPEEGDWYARLIYYQGSAQYMVHNQKYGHPSEFGFKDVIHEWKADKWDPDKLVALYKRAGAQYFFAMASHHDNMDLWDSQYQPWNSVNVGPQKDIMAGWAEAAKKHGLPFGVSIHSSHAWIWYESSCGSDKEGEKAGIPYDGTLTKDDGKGLWWEGLDPQDLYAQNHELSLEWDNPKKIYSQWSWKQGASIPDQKYCDKFYNRTIDLINRYKPDLIYFDDRALPLWPVSDAGLKIVAHFYNSNAMWHNGKLEAVVFGKRLTNDQRKAIVLDIERGIAGNILPYSWQTCTCIGGWHYDRKIYENNGYKNAITVIQMLADIVSKNGNLLLNIPVRGDGTIDEKEVKILEDIAAWMDVNKECIFNTRPWKIFGEGPASEATSSSGRGFREGRGKPFTEKDIRFTTKDDVLYAIILNCPGETEINIVSLAKGNLLTDNHKITSVTQLGNKNKLKWTQTEQGLSVKVSGTGVVVLKITGVL